MRQRERPVISMVRLGRQTAPIMEPMQYALLKVNPRATNRSRFGVWISELPNAPIVSQRWSSVRISRIFGGDLLPGVDWARHGAWVEFALSAETDKNPYPCKFPIHERPHDIAFDPKPVR